MVKISGKEFLIGTDDILKNYQKLTNGLNLKKVVFGLSRFEVDRINPEYIIYGFEYVNKDLYKCIDGSYKFRNSVTNFETKLVNDLLNKYFGIPIRYYLIYEEM